MRDLMRQMLDEIPPLGQSADKSFACKMCGGKAHLLDVVDFNKFCSVSNPLAYGPSQIGVPYYSCEDCDCLFTNFFDSWNVESFRRYVYNDDYVKVDGEYIAARPARNAHEMKDILSGMEGCRILDYGSGSGVFANMMREYGFANTESYDPFSNPKRPIGKFEIVTAFEVIEHSPAPLATLGEIQEFLTNEGCVIFSQALQPMDISTLKGAWWYLGPRNGHVTTFSHKTMVRYAETAKMTFFTTPQVYGFAKSGTGRAVLECISRTCQVKRLTAGEGPQFHGEEPYSDMRAPFRWSASDMITWLSEKFGPGYTLIKIPFAIEVSPSFAEKCKILDDGVELPTFVRNSTLTAETDFEGVATISLSTPPCRSPHDLRGVSDYRKIGLAILTCEYAKMSKQ